ncbi:MAG: hypothetical protein V1720_19215 [bacterium]
MKFSIHDFIGAVGVSFIIITYFLLQLRKIKSESLHYSLLNLTGSLMIIYSLLISFNISAFLIEFFWAIISLFGIVNFFRLRKKS